jgi:xanthine dehydrogenase accessory factor
MLELAEHLLPVLRAGRAAAVVTVTGVARSAPRGPGAAMAVLEDGRVIGSISGGCVEGDALLLATATLVSGRCTTATLGFSDDAAHAAGLACGGSVEVVVHRVDPADAVALDALERVAAGLGACVGIDPADGSIVADPAQDSGLVRIEHRPRPRLVVVGAGEHAMALCRVAAAAGFVVAVTDVWERLVTAERFPAATRLVVGDPAALLPGLWGEDAASAAVCVLTHDERVDVPALAVALRAGVGFVGAMGARSTVAHRRTLLRAAGIDAADLDRLHSPLGLDLGGTSPDETALAVLAEIVAHRHSGTGLPLRKLAGPVHRRVAPATVPASACAPERASR